MRFKKNNNNKMNLPPELYEFNFKGTMLTRLETYLRMY